MTASFHPLEMLYMCCASFSNDFPKVQRKYLALEF